MGLWREVSPGAGRPGEAAVCAGPELKRAMDTHTQGHTCTRIYMCMETRVHSHLCTHVHSRPHPCTRPHTALTGWEPRPQEPHVSRLEAEGPSPSEVAPAAPPPSLPQRCPWAEGGAALGSGGRRMPAAPVAEVRGQRIREQPSPGRSDGKETLGGWGSPAPQRRCGREGGRGPVAWAVLTPLHHAPRPPPPAP